VGIQIVQPVWKAEVPKNKQENLPYAVFISRDLSKTLKLWSQRDINILIFIALTFTVVKIWK
jgi:hypothetical protein